MGGRPSNPRTDCVTFNYQDLLSMIMAAARLSWVQIGDSVAILKGLPIGSPASKTLCSLIIAQSEAIWTEARAYEYVPLPPGLSWTDVVACCRYVDDKVMVSNIYCHACLEKFLSQIYPIQFDVSPLATSSSWLDLSLTFQDNKLVIDWQPRLIETSPWWDCPISQLISYLLGRAHRWYEIGFG